MKAVVDFIQVIVDRIKMLVDAVVSGITFVADFIKDLLYVIGLTGDALLTLPEVLKWLPAAVSAVIITILTIAVVYKIMGREG